jgi:hypothetical protein
VLKQLRIAYRAPRHSAFCISPRARVIYPFFAKNQQGCGLFLQVAACLLPGMGGYAALGMVLYENSAQMTRLFTIYAAEEPERSGARRSQMLKSMQIIKICPICALKKQVAAFDRVEHNGAKERHAPVFFSLYGRKSMATICDTTKIKKPK